MRTHHVGIILFALVLTYCWENSDGDFLQPACWNGSVSNGPLQFLEILKKTHSESTNEHKLCFVTVVDAPTNWISKADVPKLAALLDSKEPCAPVVHVVSSHLIFTSTVGQEAAYLLDGFRKGKYPPAQTSDSVKITDIKTWWMEYKTKYYPMPAD